MIWSVICCEPQRERKLGAALEQSGYDVFVPTYTAWRGSFSRYTQITRVLIPGYVFAVVPESVCYAFRGDGALHVLPMTIRQAEAVGAAIARWHDDLVEGLYDEARPKETKVRAKPTRRNRKARRMAGEAKRKALAWGDGLRTILDEMAAPQDVAA